MKKLLSLPPNLVGCFHDITHLPADEWFCTNDPVGTKLGSGGGTTWLLRAAYEAEHGNMTFDEWLASDKRPLADRADVCLRMHRRARYSHRCRCSVGSVDRVSTSRCFRFRCRSIIA